MIYSAFKPNNGGRLQIMGFKKTGSYLLILATVASLSLAGCGGEKKAEEKKAEAPAPATQAQAPQEGMPGAQHPAVDKTAEDIQKLAHSSIKTQKEVFLKEEVKAKWQEVKLELTEGKSKASQAVTAKVGSTVKLDERFKLKVDAFVPDYAIAENRIESRSNEANNPAVLVELMEGDKTVAKGWIFKDFPEFNSYTDDRFPVKLLGPGVDKAREKQAEPPTQKPAHKPGAAK